jgi:hypothetical protein
MLHVLCGQLMRQDLTQLSQTKQRAPLKIRLPAVEVRVIVKKIAPTSINMAEGRRQRLLDGSEPNI